MARKTRRRKRYVYQEQQDPYGKTYVTGTYGYNKRHTPLYARARQRVKRTRLLLSPSYFLTPKPVKRILAKTNLPTLRTIIYRSIRGTNILTGGVKDPCKRNQDARRARYFRKKHTSGAAGRPPQRRNHKC